MQKIYHITLFIFLLLTPNIAFSQDYIATKLELFSGKSDLFVDDLATDSKGFVWFLSKGKLYRYNGYKSLDIIETIPIEHRPTEIFNHILIDEEDRLWIAGLETLYFFDLIKWELQKYSDVKLPTGSHQGIIELKLSPRGQIFVRYENGDFVIMDEGQTVMIPNSYLSKSNISNSIESFEFWNDKAWLGSNAGELYSINLSSDFEVTGYNLGSKFPVSKIIPRGNFMIINLWYSGFIRVSFSSSQECIIEQIDQYHNTAMTIAKTWEYLNTNEENQGWKLQSDFLDNLFVLNQIVDVSDAKVYKGDLFLATSNGIWSVYNKTKGISTLIPGNSVNKSVRDIHQFPDGSIFFCSYGGCEYIQSDGTISYLHEFRIGYNFLPLDDYRLLIGLEGGMAKIFDKRKLEFESLNYHLPDSIKNSGSPFPNYVLSLAEDDRYIYFGSINSLWKFNKETQVLQPALYLDRFTSNLSINSISVIEDGLLLSTSRGLMGFHNGKLKKIFPKSGNMEIYEHVVISDTIWLGTRGSGVIAIDLHGNHLLNLNEENGLSGNIVYSLNFANGYLVAGTGGGLSIISNGKIKRLDEKDGLVHNEFNHSASYFSALSNKLYLGGLKGYTVLNMENEWFTDSTISNNYFTQINVYNPEKSLRSDYYSLPYSSGNKLELAPGQNVLKVSVGNPQSFKSNLRLEYKISEIADLWQPMPLGNEITLMGIPPGSYELSVRPTHFKNSGSIQLNLSQLPTFYQTWLFKIIVFSLFPLVIWAWYRLRLNKIKREQTLRTKIASDLHDEVGGLLTGISMQAEYLGLKKKDEAEKSFLNKIVSSSNEAVQAMGEIVWSIDSRNDTWESFIAKLREYSNSLFENSKVELIFLTEGKPSYKLNQKERIVLYRIFKEALNNCCKHSQANTVKVLIRFLEGQVMLSVEDNGVGDTSMNRINSGQGIKNMEARAASIQADFKMKASRSGVQINLLTKKKYTSHPFG